MASYEHKLKNAYLGSPYNEGTPLIPGDYTLLRGPCDEGFHVPLKEEWDAIQTIIGGANNFMNKLYIPLAGDRRGSDGTWSNNNGAAELWASSHYGSTSYYISNNGSTIAVYHTGRRSYGYSIRGFRNTPIVPDETWTETLSGKVWYNSDLGLISVLVGTNQYITMQDKNVGATVVWNDGDALTNDNRGKYFQRGNNHGFERNSSGDKSSTLVDASDYGPSNPYSSSTFITASSSPYDRSSVQNDNLRGYTDFYS